MKRSAEEAFGGTFQPSGAALMDPKAYFAQWQQAAAAEAVVAEEKANAFVEKSELQQQLETVSAVKCASIVQEKGQNFSPVVAIEALCTMAKKSSFKLREDLFKQPHVRQLCKRVQEILKARPGNVDMFDISRAAEALAKFPDDARGDAAVSVGAVANSLSNLKSSDWSADSAAKLLWSLARYGKGEEIKKHKQAVSHVVKELVRDKGRRVHDLSYEGLTHILWAVTRARFQKRTGDLQSVHTEDGDNLLFQIAAKRVIDEIDRFPVTLLADIIYTHHEIGIRNERLFRVICPKIVSKQNEIREDQMAKCIKAYARFMIPLKEEAQGFRTMAVVQKGDFLRPSDKPKPQGKKTFDKPQALYPEPMLHAKQ